MAASFHTWHNIDREIKDAIPCNNNIITVEVEGKKICVTRFREQYYGFAYTCPHAGGILANGKVDDRGMISCPLHKYAFSLKNGFNVSGEGFFLKTYPIETRDDGIFVRL